jgi:hypothetical protein
MKAERVRRRGLRLPGGLLLAAAGLLLLWQLAAELVEPRVLLHVSDWLDPPPTPAQALTVGGTLVRLYEDTRPHIGKIAGLQKGLVWVVAGQEVIEEGYGLGCPIVESGGRAYVSRHAETTVAMQAERVLLTKRYTMDTVDTPPQLLRPKFRPAPPLGVVTVRYDIAPDGVIHVEVDFSELTGSWERVYLMNEQGAARFTRYRDPRLDLPASGIGIWQWVGESTPWACFDSGDGRLSFCLELDEPAGFYYGREQTHLYNWRGVTALSWSGMDIELGPRQRYRYRIVLEVR